MNTKLLQLGLLALVIVCPCEVITGLDLCVAAYGATEAAKVGELDPQLNLAKDALLDKGSSEQMRVNAASVMLLSENALARGIVIDALKQTENVAVRNAVCKALIQGGIGQGTFSDIDDFIDPLLGVLAADNAGTAKLAAEATLIFGYEQISERLDKLVNDSSSPLRVKLMAIYALELHPDVRAAIALLRFVDSSEKAVSEEAERALLALEIPVGDDAEARKGTIKEFLAEDPAAFLQRRLIRKESQIRIAKVELTVWQGRYLQALGEVYTAISDDVEKAKFLGGHLGSSERVVRLWALERIRQDRVGTGPNPKLPGEVGVVLVGLVSDKDRGVRLKTASVLSFMPEVNSAQQLLSQLDGEDDDQVRNELFSALGRACYNAFLPNSKIKISPEIRKQTLKWAAIYLSDEGPAKIQRGAKVLKMLLEQNGLTDSEADKYFRLLAQRYVALTNESDGPLRGELLSAMATLCAPQSVHKAQSGKRFGRLFETALGDKTDFVRESAVDGLIYIDKVAALKRLRKDFVGDSSVAVRKKLIALAAEVGGQEDLAWLADKIGVSSEREQAWPAMLKIFNGADADVLNRWVETFSAETGSTGASDSQKITFLEVAKRKAVAENKPKMLQSVKEKLAALYSKTGQFERAGEYFGKLYDAASTVEAKKELLPDLLYVYLRWPKVDLAAKLVESCLMQEDLDANDVVIRSVDAYLAKLPAGADPNALLDAFEKIKVSGVRPLWHDRLKQWAIRFGKAKAGGKSEPDGT